MLAVPLTDAPHASGASRSSPTLLDHLVRLEENGWGNGEAEGLGGLEVDHQLEFGGLLHGEVGWFGAMQYLVHIDGGAPVRVKHAWPIGCSGRGTSGPRPLQPVASRTSRAAGAWRRGPQSVRADQRAAARPPSR